MEAVRTSETSVNFNVTTRRYIPEDSKLQIFIIQHGTTFQKSHLSLHLPPKEMKSCTQIFTLFTAVP
jgi:hypothetical protein